MANMPGECDVKQVGGDRRELLELPSDRHTAPSKSIRGTRVTITNAHNPPIPPKIGFRDAVSGGNMIYRGLVLGASPRSAFRQSRIVTTAWRDVRYVRSITTCESRAAPHGLVISVYLP